MVLIKPEHCLSVLVLLWSVPTKAADASIICQHMLLTELHEILMYCGEKIDDTSQKRYMQLRDELSTFIQSNARPNASGKPLATDMANYDKRFRQLLQSESALTVCNRSDYSHVREAFYRYTSDEGLARVRDALKDPKDPEAGGCI